MELDESDSPSVRPIGQRRIKVALLVYTRSQWEPRRPMLSHRHYTGLGITVCQRLEHKRTPLGNRNLGYLDELISF